MLVPDKRCRVCDVVKKDKQLLKRIYESSWYLPYSQDTLMHIYKDYKHAFSYSSIKNHTKKHQFIDSTAYHDKMLEQVDKQAEKNAVLKAVRAQDAIQTILNQGHKRLEDGEIKVENVNQLISASKVKLDSDAKEKDHQLKMMDMVSHFLSGEGATDRVYVEPEPDS